MLKALHLQNFKAFESQELNLSTLTLLSGMNGMGKSSVIQALLLLRQSYKDRPNASTLILNGDLVQLGTGRDVLFEGAREEKITLRLNFQAQAFRKELSQTWTYAYDKVSDALEAITPIETVEYNGEQIPVFSLCSLVSNFNYLQAERLGPRASFAMSEYWIKERILGSRGEYTAHFLYTYRDEHVGAPALQLESADSAGLIDQVTAWLSYISPGTRIDLQSFNQMDLMQMTFGFERGRETTNYYRSTNVGFGITYALPLLVALLSARSGDVILLENPEAHLHPRGQAKIGELIARAAAAGIQVIVETHSDHLLNGIRIATKNKQITPDDIALHFFQRPEQEIGIGGVEVITPTLDEDGRLDFRPAGFFDEYSESMRKLM